MQENFQKYNALLRRQKNYTTIDALITNTRLWYWCISLTFQEYGNKDMLLPLISFTNCKNGQHVPLLAEATKLEELISSKLYSGNQLKVYL